MASQVSNDAFKVIFPRYAELLSENMVPPNESIEQFLRDELPRKVQMVRNMESCFNAFLTHFTNIILKRPQHAHLIHSLILKANDKVDKYFQTLSLKVHKLDGNDIKSRIPGADPQLLRKEFKEKLESMGNLLKEKYFSGGNLARECEEEITMRIYVLFQIYHFLKGDPVAMANKYKIGEQDVLWSVSRNEESGDISSLITLDPNFIQNVEDTVLKRCRPFISRRELLESKFRQALREGESRVGANLNLFVESLLSKERGRISRELSSSLGRQLRSLQQGQGEEEVKDMINESQNLKREFAQIKNTTYFLDIMRGNFSEKYKMQINRLQNVFYLTNLQKYLQDVSTFLQKVLTLEEKIIRNRKDYMRDFGGRVDIKISDLLSFYQSKPTGPNLSQVMLQQFELLESALYGVLPQKEVNNVIDNTNKKEERERRDADRRRQMELKAKEDQRRREEEKIKLEERRQKEEERIRLAKLEREEKDRQRREEGERAEQARRAELQRRKQQKARKDEEIRLAREEQQRKKDQQKRQREADDKKRRQQQFRIRSDEEEKKNRQKQDDKRRREDEKKRILEIEEEQKRQREFELRLRKQREEQDRICRQNQRKSEQERIKQEKQQKQIQNRKKEEDRLRQDKEKKQKQQQDAENKRKEEQRKREQKQKQERQQRELENNRREQQRKDREKRQLQEKQRKDREKKEKEAEDLKREQERKKKEEAMKSEKQKRDRDLREQREKQQKAEEERIARQKEEKKRKEEEQKIRKQKDRRERQEKQRQQRLKIEKAEKQRIQREKLEKEKKQKQRLEKEKIERQKLERERIQRQEEQKRQKQKLERQKREAQQKVRLQKERKERQERERKAEADRKKKQQQQNAKIKKIQPKKSSGINYGDFDDILDDDLDEMQKAGKIQPSGISSGMNAQDDYDQDFDEEADKGEQISTKQLIGPNDLKCLNDYMKGTSYARKNKVNAEMVNKTGKYLEVFEEFIQNKKLFVFDPAISKAVLDLGLELTNPDTTEEDLHMSIDTIKEEMMRAYDQIMPGEEMFPATKYVYPFSFNNEYNIRLIEMIPAHTYFKVVFNEPMPSDEAVAEKFQCLIQGLLHIFELEGEPSLEEFVINEESKQVLDTFDRDMPCLLLLFALHYEQANPKEILINQYTIQRFFYTSNVIEHLYDSMKEGEQIQEFFSKMAEKYSTNDKIKIHNIAVNSADPEYSQQLTHSSLAIKEDYKKGKQVTALASFSIEIEEEGELTDKVVVYMSIDRASPKPVVNYFLVSKDGDEQQNATVIFELISEGDEDFQVNVYTDYTRHNCLSTYSDWTLPLWAHAITKRKLSSLQAIRAMTFAMTPYYLAYKEVD